MTNIKIGAHMMFVDIFDVLSHEEKRSYSINSRVAPHFIVGACYTQKQHIPFATQGLQMQNIR